MEMGDGGTKGKASKMESAVEVRFVVAIEACDMRGSIRSSKDRGTLWAGGES